MTKRPLEMPNHRWKDTTQMDIGKIGMAMMNLTELVQNRFHCKLFVEVSSNLQIS